MRQKIYLAMVCVLSLPEQPRCKTLAWWTAFSTRTASNFSQTAHAPARARTASTAVSPSARRRANLRPAPLASTHSCYPWWESAARSGPASRWRRPRQVVACWTVPVVWRVRRSSSSDLCGVSRQAEARHPTRPFPPSLT